MCEKLRSTEKWKDNTNHKREKDVFGVVVFWLSSQKKLPGSLLNFVHVTESECELA